MCDRSHNCDAIRYSRHYKMKSDNIENTFCDQSGRIILVVFITTVSLISSCSFSFLNHVNYVDIHRICGQVDQHWSEKCNNEDGFAKHFSLQTVIVWQPLRWPFCTRCREWEPTGCTEIYFLMTIEYSKRTKCRRRMKWSKQIERDCALDTKVVVL